MNSSIPQELATLAKVAGTTSPVEKIQILRTEATPLLKDILYYTYNPFYRYWIKKVPLFEHQYPSVFNWPMFKNILDNLRHRVHTGSDAENLVVGALRMSDPEDARLFRKVLERDLSVGVGVQTLLDSFGEDFIPTFEVMKAKKISDGIEPTFPCIIEPKLDGVRCFVIKSGDEVTLWSRRGHVFENYPQIVEEIKSIDGEFILDGELVQRGSFQSTMSQVRRKYAVDTSDSLLTVFDGFALDVYTPGTKVVNWLQIHRRQFIKDLLEDHVGNNLELIESVVVGNWDIATMFYNQYLEMGFEGAMLKDLNAFYYFKRHKAWLKMKPTDTLDLEVCGFQEGEGKYVGRLGAIIVKLPIKSPNGEAEYEVRVGGGYSDSQRSDFWNIRRSLLGTIIEVKYDRVTKNDSGGYSLRFPRFIKLRPDKKEHDSVTI